MARKRFVTSEISTDRKIAKLAEKNPTAAALWPWFITALDDWGRMNADPVEVKLAIFPAFPYTSDDIETFIKLYHEFGIAYHYEVDGKPYLAVNPDTWLKYQTYIRKDKLEKQNSKIPEPKNAPWVAKNNNVDDLATKNVAKQQSATINVLSPSPSPSPSPSKEIYTCAPDGAQEDTHDAPKESSSPKTIDELIDEATRYTAEQRAIIREYWDTVRFTRRRGEVAPSIVKTELEYWERFPPDIVLEALNIHMTKHRDKREEYTRGIMRRLQEERRNGGDFNHTAQNRENHGRPGNRARTRTARTSACDYIGGKYGAIFEKERQAVHSTTSGSLDSE